MKTLIDFELEQIGMKCIQVSARPGARLDAAKSEAAILALRTSALVELVHNSRQYQFDPEVMLMEFPYSPPTELDETGPDAPADKEPASHVTAPNHREYLVSATECTEHHWQVRGERDGVPVYIWNIYPTTKKITADPHYPGPRILPANPWTLEGCRQAAIEAIRSRKVRT